MPRQAVEAGREHRADMGSSHAVELWEAKPGQCRWPLWSSSTEPKLVCGEPVSLGRYCRDHAKRAFVATHHSSKRLK